MLGGVPRSLVAKREGGGVCMAGAFFSAARFTFFSTRSLPKNLLHSSGSFTFIITATATLSARYHGYEVELDGAEPSHAKIMSTHQQLLQDCLVASGHVETCCLIRRKNGTIKAASYGYEVHINHGKYIYNSFWRVVAFMDCK